MQLLRSEKYSMWNKKNSMNKVNIWLNPAKEQIRECKGRALKAIQNEREKKLK